MILLRYLAAYLPGVAALLAFETVFFLPGALFPALASWFLLLVLAHLLLGRQEARTVAHWLFLVPPATLFVSGVAYVLLLAEPASRQAVAFAVSGVLFAFHWNVYLYLFQPVRYAARSLEHLSVLANVLSLFFGGVALFGLKLFVGIPAWTLALVVFAGSAALTGQSLWASKLRFREHGVLLAVFPFLLAQLAIVLLALPVTHLVAGAVLALAFYLFLGLGRDVGSGAYTRRVGHRYAVTAAVGVALLLGTAHWS